MPETEPECLLQGESLSCIRDDRTLFDGLSFQLRRGQVLLLEGRNGSGKTSLLRILCGIRQPDGGLVSWNGEDIFRLGPDYHAHMAYVGHKDGVKLDLTVFENLKLARGLGLPSDSISIDDALEQVELWDFDQTVARNLSAGQQRRLALARLLVTQAQLWVLDEPFTSLDTHGIGIVESIFSRHVAGGGMLAVTSHHQVRLSDVDVTRINLSA